MIYIKLIKSSAILIQTNVPNTYSKNKKKEEKLPTALTISIHFNVNNLILFFSTNDK